MITKIDKKGIITKLDEENKFFSKFNPKTGFYVRSGVIENGIDTGKDPFMTAYPELIDIGVMGHCVHGHSGLCIKSGVQCYQNGLKTKSPNMTLDDFKKIISECKGKTYQVALGGRGDVDQHENFEEILAYCKENDIVPNFTSSGLGFNEDIVNICKEYCGAVAISQYSRLGKVLLRKVNNQENSRNRLYIGDKNNINDYINDGWELFDELETEKIDEYKYLELTYETNDYTLRAIQMLIDADVKTNIHYVLGNNSIDEAIERLKNNDFPKGINAIIFLLHKPVGLGQESNVLDSKDKKVEEFFNLIDNNIYDFKIGFDSCTVPALINFTSNINPDSFDTCEGGRWSCYITSDMKMLPCSFDNQDMRWAYDLSNNSIQDAWNSAQFKDFRDHFKNSCNGCKNQYACMGGCPIRRQIVLCNNEEKDLYESISDFSK